MLELSIRENNGKHNLLKEKLENISISQKIYTSDEFPEPMLREGSKVYYGFDEIYQFLENQEAFVKQWYECRCGNHGN